MRDFEIVVPYTLRISFDDAVQQIVDFLPVLHGELYEPLHDLALFNEVALDPEAHTLVWPNGADFDPETLHEWSRMGGSVCGERKGVGRGTQVMWTRHNLMRLCPPVEAFA